MNRLQGKRALLTGGTTGIGHAAARLFVQEGATVAITGQDRDRLRAAAAALGPDTVPIHLDLSTLSGLRALASETSEKLGTLDILFLNAGVALPAPLAQADEAHFDRQMAINLKGPFFTIQALLPHLADGASIVLNTSAIDEMGYPGMSVYAATKAALRSLARTISAELAARRIRVNTIAPGPTDTGIYAKTGIPAEAAAAFAQSLADLLPVKRLAHPDEIARAALFLASDDSSFILGEEIAVDGGWSRI